MAERYYWTEDGMYSSEAYPADEDDFVKWEDYVLLVDELNRLRGVAKFGSDSDRAAER